MSLGSHHWLTATSQAVQCSYGYGGVRESARLLGPLLIRMIFKTNLGWPAKQKVFILEEHANSKQSR